MSLQEVNTLQKISQLYVPETDLMEKLKQLKQDQNAVVLAHYYVTKEIQDVADFVGDSFYLAQTAMKLKQNRIIMAGVHFMGESIKILNPQKRVFMPDINADCPMAHMITKEKIKEMREQYDDLAVVCYINSTAEIKAHADIICTSANAEKIVSKLSEKNIFFIPDGNLAKNIADSLSEKNIIPNQGYCPVHNQLTAEMISNLKQAHPRAPILAHPESSPEIKSLVDYMGSTSGIIKKVGEILASSNDQTKSENLSFSDARDDEFIIVTEQGINTELEKLYPAAKFYYPENMICADMKMLTLEKVYNVLQKDENEIFVDQKIMEQARRPLERMLELGA